MEKWAILISLFGCWFSGYFFGKGKHWSLLYSHTLKDLRKMVEVLQHEITFREKCGDK